MFVKNSLSYIAVGPNAGDFFAGVFGILFPELCAHLDGLGLGEDVAGRKGRRRRVRGSRGRGEDELKKASFTSFIASLVSRVRIFFLCSLSTRDSDQAPFPCCGDGWPSKRDIFLLLLFCSSCSCSLRLSTSVFSVSLETAVVWKSCKCKITFVVRNLSAAHTFPSLWTSVALCCSNG